MTRRYSTRLHEAFNEYARNAAYRHLRRSMLGTELLVVPPTSSSRSISRGIKALDTLKHLT